MGVGESVRMPCGPVATDRAFQRHAVVRRTGSAPRTHASGRAGAHPIHGGAGPRVLRVGASSASSRVVGPERSWRRSPDPTTCQGATFVDATSSLGGELGRSPGAGAGDENRTRVASLE